MKWLGSKTLETNRLILRPTQEEDLKILWSILLKKEISKYYLVSKINEDWEQEKKWQYKKLERALNKDTFIWTIQNKETLEVMGQISVQEGPKPDTPDIRDIGWFLDTPYQKKGYAYEAALEVLKYMFLEVEIKAIETCIASCNPNSWHLIKKLGGRPLGTKHLVKYTYLDEKLEIEDWELTKADFLKEYFRKQELYITEDIDKDPYIKHISDDWVLNVTGESGSGKTTSLEPYQNNPDCIIIDTDSFKKENTKEKNIQGLKKYIEKKYGKLPDICSEFDSIYQSILEYFENSNKQIIIDSAQFRNMKDLSLLKGDIIILRTCINNCYARCLERYNKNQKGATFEELSAYSNYKKNIYKWYHQLNDFLDKVDQL